MFIEHQTPFHSQPSAQTAFLSKTDNFLFTKIPYEFLHCFHRSWSFVSGQQCKSFRIQDKAFSTIPAGPIRIVCTIYKTDDYRRVVRKT